MSWAASGTAETTVQLGVLPYPQAALSSRPAKTKLCLGNLFSETVLCGEGREKA